MLIDGVRLDKSVNTVYEAEKLVGTCENLKKDNVGTRKNWKKQPVFGFTDNFPLPPLHFFFFFLKLVTFFLWL